MVWVLEIDFGTSDDATICTCTTQGHFFKIQQLFKKLVSSS